MFHWMTALRTSLGLRRRPLSSYGSLGRARSSAKAADTRAIAVQVLDDAEQEARETFTMRRAPTTRR